MFKNTAKCKEQVGEQTIDVTPLAINDKRKIILF